MQPHQRGIITIPPRNRQSTDMAFLVFVFSVCARGCQLARFWDKLRDLGL